MNAPTLTYTGSAELIGTPSRPKLLVRFGFGMTHAMTGESLQNWVKGLPGRRFNGDVMAWEVWGIGKNPDNIIASAGLEILWPTEGPLAGFTSLAQLTEPVAKLDENNRTTLVLPRFTGNDEVQRLIDNSGVWDNQRELIRMPVIDVVRGASPRPGIRWDQASIDRAYELHARSPLLSPELGPHAAAVANALTPGEVIPHLRAIQDVLGGPVGEFGVDLFPYQVVGAYGVAAGHTLLADSPGVGKTYQSLAATAALRADGMLIVCPPVVTTNWAREVVKSGFASEDEIAVFRTGRKAPVIDDKKVVIISDSSLASKRHLIFEFAAWANARSLVTVAYDEIHRAKTMGSKRADAVLDMMALMNTARPIGITGTPVLAGPHELVNQLEFTGHLGPIFGGAGPFLEKFCTRDRFGSFHPKKRALPELHRILNEHVWMRRTKAQVLPFLPKRHITAVPLDLDTKTMSEYRKTHKGVVEKIVEWFQAFRKQEGRFPKIEEVEEFAQDNLRFASELRRAAGMTKVPIALEMVQDWVKANPDEPVILWAHHQDVIQALKDAADALGVANGVIKGGISSAERDRLVDGFQSGRIPVLICSITAAGVGITLTRGSNALFVESDWTPALMLQAIDRQHRIGQENEVHAEILLALGTLDEHIQGTLAKKGETLEAILGDDSNSVAVGVDGEEDLMNLKQVMAQLVREAAGTLGLQYDLAA